MYVVFTGCGSSWMLMHAKYGVVTRDRTIYLLNQARRFSARFLASAVLAGS
jgi:hypothetical protein